MKKLVKFRWPLLFLFLGLMCQFAFYVIGSRVDENGILVESFALLPISLLFIFLSLVMLVACLIKGRTGRE
ncbi:DUF3955 domain-containing protein [uncultured Shewanella sp.]|uniref:DUF3955 domain-containing protein n=1 Tax=uncultured Shewanella sp. TaxID=173975 RepID=UPI002636A709|nr:DUF3955 domain-containing protein [uncultured Shewanella sp.]